MQKKGGMWAGYRGLAKGCEHNQKARDKDREQLQNKLDQLFLLLHETEAAIDAAGAVLSISQPARMFGKHSLRWWKVKHRSPYRDPVIVKWVMQRNGEMTPKPARALKVRKDRSSTTNAAETQECLDILAALIKRRKEIKKRIFSMRKSLRGLERVSYRLNNEMERIEILRSQVINNLIENGYEVEPHLIEGD